MDKLKQALFEETLYQKKQYQHCKQIFGELDFLTLAHENRYKSLYSVIIEGECENEFIKWAENRETAHYRLITLPARG